MTNPQAERLDSIDQRLAQLVTITEQQAETARLQQAKIERFAGIFTDQAKAISELSQVVKLVIRR